MHTKTARIIKLDATKPPHNWGRFVALLCMMMFYTRFVEGGTYLCTLGYQHYTHNHPNRFWVELASVGLAIVMCVCARALWRNGRYRCWYLVLAIAALLALQAVEVVDIGNYGYRGIFTLWQYFRLNPWIGVPIKAIQGNLPWTTLLVAAIWLEQDSDRHLLRRHHIWVILAMVWCIATLLPQFDSLCSLVNQMSTLLLVGNLDIEPFRSSLITLAPGLVLAGLLKGSRWATWPALLIACVIAVPPAIYSWTICWLVRDAIQALFISVSPKLLGTPPILFPLNCCYLDRSFFQEVFVTPIMAAGPWLLIAYYARHYPMRIPPDDGSPYPRRYCGNCEYNLHGIEAKICPECGRQLVA